MRKDELIAVLEGLLKDVLKARFAGAERSKLSRAHGYADGYMRALLDAGLTDKASLLRVVSASNTAFLAEEDTRGDATSGVNATGAEAIPVGRAVA